MPTGSRESGPARRPRQQFGKDGLALAGDSRAGGVRFAPTIVDFPLRDAWVPMGYPNYLEHPVAEMPCLGYTGFRRIVGRVADAVLRAEAARNILPDPAARGG